MSNALQPPPLTKEKKLKFSDPKTQSSATDRNSKIQPSQPSHTVTTETETTDSKLEVYVSNCNSTIIINNLTRHAAICNVKLQHFECKICSKKFKSKRYLNEHNKGHQEGHGYQCSGCGDVLKYRASLYKHKQRTGHS